MATEYLSHIDGHGTVKVNGDIRNAVLVNQLTNEEHQLLSTFNRKGWDDNPATCLNRRIDHLLQLFKDIATLLVVPLPIGRFHDDIVR